jgi:hypothetical protein
MRRAGIPVELGLKVVREFAVEILRKRQYWIVRELILLLNGILIAGALLKDN